MKKIGIIGAGASGLYCAINLKNENTDVTILEKNDEIGKKILITGNGRCNLTNTKTYKEFLDNIVSNKKFLYSSFSKHDNFATIDFFTKNGLALITEDDDRVFPKSEKAKDVIKFFENKIIEKSVKLITNQEVIDIMKDKNFIVKTQNKNYEFDILIIATGGLSYPNTGSTGDGFKFAKKFNHIITKTFPSLVPIFFKDKDLCNLKAVTLENVKLIIKTDEDIFSKKGSVLLTNKFISGPIVLNLSSLTISSKINSIKLDLSEDDYKALDKKLIKVLNENPKKDIINILKNFLIASLAEIILKRLNINENLKAYEINKKQRLEIINTIKNFTLEFDRFGAFNTAIITKGGVDISQIDPKTMQSKFVKGLYFIGEVLDIDGLTGGYNLQLAFTTAYQAQSSIKEDL